MKEEKVNRFLRVSVNHKPYKIFLDDLHGIYRLKPKKTPPLRKYHENSDNLTE